MDILKCLTALSERKEVKTGFSPEAAAAVVLTPLDAWPGDS